jgi:hypothetical protein
LPELQGYRAVGKALSASGSPRRKLVIALFQFVADPIDAEYISRRIRPFEPIPIPGTDIEAIVFILRLDEGICVEQVGHLSGEVHFFDKLVKSLNLSDSQQLEGIPVRRSSFKDAFDKRLCKAPPGTSPLG